MFVVSPMVVLHISRCRETLSTDITLIRLLSRVDSHVSGQVLFVCEFFIADLASVLYTEVFRTFVLVKNVSAIEDLTAI